MKKFFTLALVFLFTMATLSGCGKKTPPGTDKTPDSASPGNEGALEPVSLTLYFVSEAPNDLDLVLEPLNEMLQRDLNTTIKIKFTTWTDYTQKYDLALKTGDDIDLIYSAPWMSYPQYSNQGAFLELKDLLPVYAPKLWEQIEESVWHQVSVNGHIYAVPALNYVYGSKGVLYRKDLMDKYDLPEPNSVENVERYLLGVQEHEPDQGLFRVYVEQTGTGEAFEAHSMLLNFRYPMVSEEGSYYGLVGDYGNPSELIDYWSSDAFLEDMKILKRWSDYGFWSKSVMSESPESESFGVGKTVLSSGGLNPGKASGARQQLKAINPDWVSEYFMFARMHGYAYRATPMADMTSIPYNAKNPERALMVLEKLMTDPVYYKLFQYGLEGKHYTLEDGFYTPILDEDGENAYDYGAFAWSMENKAFSIPSADGEYFENIYAELETIRTNTPFGAADIAGGFMENPDPYQAEKAALGNVIMQYLAPLEAGMVDDVDAGVAQFRQKAKEAGLEKIHEEFKKQWAAYCEAYDYKK